MSRRLVTHTVAAAVVLTAGAAALGACGDDGSSSTPPQDLSIGALRGLEVADHKGCSACHRAGGVGPAWEGLYGSEVELSDGSTVIADEAYVTRAITDPGADVAAGYSVAMPENDLTDEEVALVVGYLRAIGTGAPATTAGDGA